MLNDVKEIEKILKLITDPTGKANSLNRYYASILDCECSMSKFNQQNQVNPSQFLITL
jgi:hypothetical protein